MTSAMDIDHWKSHWNDLETFFKEKDIDLSTLKGMNTFLRENGMDVSKIKREMASQEGITGKADAIMGCLWSSIAEYRSLGDLMKSSITFLSSLTNHLDSVIPYSRQLKQVFPIVTAFLNLVSKENSIVKKLAEEVQADDVVKHEIAGIIEKLSTSQIYVGAINDPDNIETNVIQIMIANVNIDIGVEHIGNLKSRIESLISCDMDKPQAERCLLYINLFVRVSVLRHALLLQMLTVLRLTNYSPQTATAITKVMEKDKDRARELLRFLESPTIEKSVTLFAFFDFSKQEHIVRFATELNLKLQDLSGNFDKQDLCIQPNVDEKGEEYVLSRPTFAKIKALKKVKRQTNSDDVLFRFEFLPGSQNLFYIRSSDEKYYVWMKTDRFCKCCEDKPGNDGEWIVIRVDGKETFYLFSPKKWPNQFLYLDKGIFESVRGLDDKRTCATVKQCLFKLVPPIKNQTGGNEPASASKENPREECSKQLEYIRKFLKSKSINAESLVSKIKSHLSGQSGDTIASVVRNMKTAIGFFKCENTSSKMNGVLELLGNNNRTFMCDFTSSSALTPVFRLNNSLLRLVWQEKNIESFVQEGLQMESELKKNMAEDVSKFVQFTFYLRSIEDKNGVNETDVSTMMSQSLLLQEIRSIRKLRSQIENHFTSYPTVGCTVFRKKIQSLTIAFTKMTTLQSVVLWQMFTVAKKHDDSSSSADVLLKTIQRNKEQDEHVLKLLEKHSEDLLDLFSECSSSDSLIIFQFKKSLDNEGDNENETFEVV
ncbi:uncharacterized protein LOC133181475 [Saccostrea echinata]|uniref:uncharacterized protein LOC133181475 n=1 Tax=Saccostrea echinata TaxID=191078 RepID=UPI002A80B023|nr:uncharacterized protein LOC133181475 [Saccostrea echinata]